jgi:hypothetical protein
MRNALMGSEVCSETIVIRSNDEWKRVVRSLRFDGERYDATELRAAGGRLPALEQGRGLVAVGS